MGHRPFHNALSNFSDDNVAPFTIFREDDLDSPGSILSGAANRFSTAPTSTPPRKKSIWDPAPTLGVILGKTAQALAGGFQNAPFAKLGKIGEELGIDAAYNETLGRMLAGESFGDIKSGRILSAEQAQGLMFAVREDRAAKTKDLKDKVGLFKEISGLDLDFETKTLLVKQVAANLAQTEAQTGTIAEGPTTLTAAQKIEESALDRAGALERTETDVTGRIDVANIRAKTATDQIASSERVEFMRSDLTTTLQTRGFENDDKNAIIRGASDKFEQFLPLYMDPDTFEISTDLDVDKLYQVSANLASNERGRGLVYPEAGLELPPRPISEVDGVEDKTPDKPKPKIINRTQSDIDRRSGIKLPITTEELGSLETGIPPLTSDSTTQLLNSIKAGAGTVQHPVLYLGTEDLNKIANGTIIEDKFGNRGKVINGRIVALD